MSTRLNRQAARRPDRATALALTLALIVPALALGQGAPVTRAAPDATGAAVAEPADTQALFELVNQVERLQRAVQDLRGEVEQQGYALEQLRARQRDLYVDVDRRLQQIEQGAVAAPAGTVPGGLAGASAGAEPPLRELGPARAPDAGLAADAGTEPGLAIEVEQRPAAPPLTAAVPGHGQAQGATGANDAAPGPVPPADPAAAEAAYRAAFELLKAGQYDDAIAAFNDYLVEYPGSQYADNAQYWLGEAYYVTRQFEAAIAEYQKLMQAFPQSTKASHALLKIGYSYQELGRLDTARAQLERVRSSYPGTTAARLAEERLARIATQAP